MTVSTDTQQDYSLLSQSALLSIAEKQAQQIQTLTAHLAWFNEQFKLLKSKHYGKSSEQQSVLQPSLFDEDDQVQQVDPGEGPHQETITYTRSKPSRPEKHLDTRHLPREKHYIDLNAAEKQCGCGEALEKFGEDIKEELVFIPATLKVIEHIRAKYTCRECDTVKMPDVIELPLSKSKASAALLTEVMLNKYRYHLPFYRQRKLFAAHGMDIPDNTLGGWAMQSAERLEPLREAFYQQLSQVNVLQADETPVKILDPEKKAYVWLYHCYLPGKRFVLFEFNLSRSSRVVNERLKDFKGILQTDGYSGYEGLRRREDIINLGCWDHARRKFTDVVKAAGHNKSGKAGQMLEKIGKLYEIEREIKDLSFSERKRIRQAKAKPKLEAIYSFLYKTNAPPKSLLGVAVTYCKNQWAQLIRYVDHGEAQISNCFIENQVRPFAIGKKNWLFVGNEASASKAALLYSLIQSCELNKLDARKYLIYVLNQVHRMRRKEVDPATLLPNTIDPTLFKST
mgnify:CR=1 FL=1